MWPGCLPIILIDIEIPSTEPSGESHSLNTRVPFDRDAFRVHLQRHNGHIISRMNV